MAVLSRAVSVTTTATRLDSITDEADSISGQDFVFWNAGSATIYIGGADVSTANGTPVPAASWSPGMQLKGGDAVYGRVASGTEVARVFEVGVG